MSKRTRLGAKAGKGALIDCAAVAVGAISFVLAAASAAELRAQEASPGASIISARALDAALKAYVSATGVQVLYESDLTTGRRSADVDANLTPDAALATLLSGTGLIAIQTGAGAFVIVPVPAPAGALPATVAGLDPRFMAALQGSVLRAICRAPQTRPGNYRVALELWVDPSGKMLRSSLVGSTGSTTTDAALLKALEGTSIQIPPPASAPQPFLMTINPQSTRDSGVCGR